MADILKYEVIDGVAVLTLGNPPVNALGTHVRVQLIAGVDRACGDDGVGAIILLGAGGTFFSGPDVEDIEQSLSDVPLAWVCQHIEDCTKPVVAAIEGTALGGGFELALSAHYRVAHHMARIGFPDVMLGLIPNAGGTQRAPRLVGAQVVLDMMLSGRPVVANAQQVAGFFDVITQDNIRDAALDFARDLIRSGAKPRRTCDTVQGFAKSSKYLTETSSRKKALHRRPERAPKEIVRCIEAAELLPFSVGLEFEQAAYDTCIASDQSKALRHAFIAERMAARFPELQGVSASHLEQIGVVGGGGLGAGLIMACLSAGFEVILVEQNSASLARAQARLARLMDRQEQSGQLDVETRGQWMRRFGADTDYVSLAHADIILDATPETLDRKRNVCAQLDAIIKEQAVIAVCTSHLDIDRVASVSDDPESVIGLNVVMPGQVARLAEVVVGQATGVSAVATTVALAHKLGKIPVRTAVADGFIASQLLDALQTAAEWLVQHGASPYEVDKAMHAYGMVLGPFQILDLVGLDRKMRSVEGDQGGDRVASAPLVSDALSSAGRLGQKTRSGFYHYPNGGHGVADPTVLETIEQLRAQHRWSSSDLTEDDIQRRCLAALANTGARLVREGIATRASDIDVVMLHGFAFPRRRGGPMMSANLAGLLHIRKDLVAFSADNAALWAPDPAFDKLIKNGLDFRSLV